MKSNLLILGAGQYGTFVREIAEATDRFSEIHFLDDNSETALGPLSEYLTYREQYASAFVAIGNRKVRMEWLALLTAAGYTVETLVHPRAFVSAAATLSPGVIVEPMAVVQSGAFVGTGSMIASGAVVKHNATVGNGCYIDCNSVILPGATVPDGIKVPCNTEVE